MRLYLLAVLAFLMCLAGAARAQADPALLNDGFKDMYNLDFERAHQAFAEYRKQQPVDPMGPVSDGAAFLFAELDRLHVLQSELFMDNDSFDKREKLTADPAVKQQFIHALDVADTMANRALARNANDENALFAVVMSHGLRADYLALIEKRDFAALAEVKSARASAQKLLALNPNYSDAYLAIGVENYLLSQRAAPMRWMLKMGGAETDKDRGIENLRITAEKGNYLLPYARVMLAVAALRDGNRNAARQYLGELSRQFPRNHLYTRELNRLK